MKNLIWKLKIKSLEKVSCFVWKLHTLSEVLYYRIQSLITNLYAIEYTDDKTESNILPDPEEEKYHQALINASLEALKDPKRVGRRLLPYDALADYHTKCMTWKEKIEIANQIKKQL
jgi:hypothetical protein